MRADALVLGAEGMLGRALCRLLPELGYRIVGAVGRAGADVTDAVAIERLLGEARPDIVFNAAAFTNVDAAEDQIEACWRVNALGPEVIARAADKAGAAVVHFSTDFVFDGEKQTPYDELDVPNPQGVYARSKLGGERLVAAATRQHFIVRVGCLYGRGGRNFPSTIAARLIAQQRIMADASRSGTPTWVDDVVHTVGCLARTDDFGLYHCTSGGETTWFDYARFLAEALGVPADRVVAADPKSMSLRAPRPRRAILDNLMLRLRGLDAMPGWQAAATAFLRAEVGERATH